jgi:2'-5' RNA ligase
MAEASAAPTRLWFFALWPAVDVANNLDAAARSAHALRGGRRMRGDSLHLTLAFLGDLSDDRLGAAETAATAVVGQSFMLCLDHLGYWRHNHILWAGTDAPPTAMLDLVGELATGLRAAGFALDSRPFAAHVTLLRNAPCQGPPRMSAPIFWPVADFVLVESKLSPRGAHYQVRRSWPLRQAEMPAPSKFGRC